MVKTPDEGASPAEHFSVPNIRHLRIVEAVARHSSISRAASEVSLSQPAVTQALAKMESALGRALFDRRQTGSYLTAAGEVFLHRVRRFIAQSDQAIRELHPADHAITFAKHVTSTQIRCLLAISRSTSFAQAARAIGISTASLQRAARELEATIRKPLYRATRHGLTLSTAGQELARKLGLATREIGAASDDIRFLDGVEGGRVSIGALPMSGAYLIGATINALVDTFPEARVSVINAPYGILLNSLRTGEIDMIFGVLRRPDWAVDLQEEALFSDPYCIIGRAGHPLASRRKISTADLLDYDWIIPGDGTPRRRQYDALFQGVAKRPRNNIETSSLSTIRSIVARSDRLTLVNRHEVETEERLKLVAILRWTADSPPLAKGITTRSNWLPTPIQQRFLGLLRRHAREASP
jgi:LysR family transcriptional regulator, regulator for genes of the gallate degradation pathway